MSKERDHCLAAAEHYLCHGMIGPAGAERGADVLMRERTHARGELFEALIDEIEKVRATNKSSEVQEAFNRLLERVAVISLRGDTKPTTQ